MTTMLDTAMLDPVWNGAVQQLCYRGLLAAFSEPGTIHPLHLPGDESAMVAVAATLIDHATTLADPQDLLGRQRRRLLGATLLPVAEASFIVADANLPPLPDFSPRLGNVFAPELGATLLLMVGTLGEGPQSWCGTGPGIADQRRWRLGGCDPSWLELRNDLCTGYPLGLDLILCDPQRILALPRTTRVVRDGPGAH